MADLMQNLIKACNPDPSKAGNTLLVLNALGMVFAAASNTVAAATDKNTSAEDKKFLVPAGVATGVANIGIYFLMTKKIIKSLEKGAAKVVESMNSEDLAKRAADFAKKTIAKKEKGLLGTGLFKNADLAESMKQNFFQNNKITETAKNLYKENVKGAGSVLGAFIGAVIGCSILTPIIRDVSAYIMQKKMEKNNPGMSEKPFRPYFDPSHIGGGYGRKQPLSMTSFMAFTSGNGRTKI